MRHTMQLGEWTVDLDAVIALGGPIAYQTNSPMAADERVGFRVQLSGGQTLDCTYRQKDKDRQNRDWKLCWTYLWQGPDKWETEVERGKMTPAPFDDGPPADPRIDTKRAFAVVARYGEVYSEHVTRAGVQAGKMDEIWFFGEPTTSVGKALLEEVDPWWSHLPRDKVHATEELCMKYLCPPLKDDDA